MKKSLIIGILMVVLLLLTITNVQAFTYKVVLTPSSTSVAKGETVNIEVALNDISVLIGEEGISGFEGILNYDESVFETISSSQLQSKNSWGNLQFNEQTKRITIYNSNFVKNNETILSIPLKVKEDTTVTSSTIKISSILSSDGQTEVTIEPVSTTVTITEKSNDLSDYNSNSATLSSIDITTAPTKTKYKVGEKFDKTGMIITAKFSDGTTSVITDYTYSPNAELAANDTKITISYTKGTVTKTAIQLITVEVATATTQTNTTTTNTTQNSVTTNSTSTNKIAQTGSETIIIPTIAVIALVAVISFVNYKRNSF